ncbi:MAG: DUF1045 domain-containing protein [Betaproteobacteria bacterium]|nr:DUF1045 domain-containing protein [Betaproteobacteria bacterium]
MNARYAVYFVPEPETALAKLGSALLGRDSEAGHPVPQPRFPGFPEEKLRALTVDARRYGLHATLKAPFFLKQGMTERDLLFFADKFVMGRQPIVLPGLAVKRIGSFFALVPSGETPEGQEAIQRINALAADAVSFFDPFRAAPSEQEIARRHPENLSARQRALLIEWGYPYVFDEYRFHITLTDRLREGAETRPLEESLRTHFGQVCNERVSVSSICFYKQSLRDTGCEFMLLKRLHFQKT